MRFFCIASLGLAAATAAQAQPADVISYTVRPGDTLSVIAAQYLDRVDRYRALQAEIHLPVDRHLAPGTVIGLPRDWLKSTPLEARVVAVRGAVSVDGRSAQIGMTLREGSTIATGASAFVSFVLSNGSKVSLPSQSRARLARLRKLSIDGSLDYSLEVDDGRLETQATHFTDPNSRYRVRTPYATSAVRGTVFRVAFDTTGKTDSLTEVLDGTVAVGAPTHAAPALVPKRTGIGIAASGAARTEVLLPAPIVRNAGELQRDDLVHFILTPINGAARYHVQVATDAGFVDVFDDRVSAQPQADFARVPNGTLFVRASAISGTGFEGLSEVASFTRRLNSIHATVEPGGHGGFRFKWFGSGGTAPSYHFQIVRAPGAVPLVDEPALATDTVELTHLPPGAYYWRVGSTSLTDGVLDTVWTDFNKLTVSATQ